jgi:23S rRNA-intervening sequence protein
VGKARAQRDEFFLPKMPEPPILLAKWYDYAKWIIERVDSFPKNQRFVFGQRLAGHALDIMELLVEAAYARDKTALLHTANRKIEMLRWLVRMAKDQTLFTARQYEFSCERLEECGRMTGGWLKQAVRKV